MVGGILYRVTIISLTLLWAVLLRTSAPAYAEAVDLITTVIRSPGSSTVRSFQANGQQRGQFKITNAPSVVLTGRFANGTSNVAHVTFTPALVRVVVRTPQGRVLGRGSTRARLRGIVALTVADLNNSGADDLLITQRNGVAIALLEPGTRSMVPSTMRLPADRRFAARASHTTINGLFALNESANEFEQYSLSGELQSTSQVNAQVRGFLVSLTLESGEAHIAAVDGSIARVLSENGSLTNAINLIPHAQVISGNFLGRAKRYSDMAVVGGTGFLNLIAPDGTVHSTGLLNLAVNSSHRPACTREQITRLRDELVAAQQQNNQAAEMRVFEQLQRLLNDPQCQKVLQTSPEQIAARHRIASQSSVVRGGEGLMCDAFEQFADGAMGHLAKSSDIDSKLVVLFPGNTSYVAATILHPVNFRIREELRDAGFGNPDQFGGRRHFRGTKLPRTYGRFILMAERADGRRVCFRLNMSRTNRID